VKKRFFFFDVDNTLTIWPTGVIPEDTLYCLNKLKESGHELAIATGRLQLDGDYFGRKAGITNIIADGGESLTIDNQLLYMEGLDISMCRDYLAYLDEYDVRWAVTCTNERKRFTRFPDIQQFIEDWDNYETVVDSKLSLENIEKFYKLFVYMTPEEEQNRGIAQMNKDIIRYGNHCILYEPMTKSKGVKAMLERFNMPHESAVVFGDGINDLSLFDPAFLNIAMGNAKPELKAKADYVTTDCDKGGILDACRKFGFIEE